MFTGYSENYGIMTCVLFTACGSIEYIEELGFGRGRGLGALRRGGGEGVRDAAFLAAVLEAVYRFHTDPGAVLRRALAFFRPGSVQPTSRLHVCAPRAHTEPPNFGPKCES